MIFSTYLVELIAIMLVVGIITGLWPLVLLCLLALLAVLAARGWRRLAPRRIEWQRQLSAERAFAGDELTLTLRVANRKLLPLPRLDIYDTVPAGLEVVDAVLVPFGAQGGRCLYRSLSMGWYEAVVWRQQLRVLERGLYRFGPLYLLSGDPFGMYLDPAQRNDFSRLIVYPRLLPPLELGFEMRHLLGEVRSQRALVTDPVRTVGARDYRRDDPLKSIHWGATARRGELQTRVYEPTTSLELTCLLDIDTFDFYWEGMQRSEVERLISTAATLCKALSEAGHSVGLITNGGAPDDQRLLRVPPGRNARQLGLLMEKLAVIMPYSVVSMGRLMRSVPDSLTPGGSVVLVSAVASAATRAALLRLRQRGHAVTWVSLAEQAPSLAGVRVFHSPPPARRARPAAS